MQTQIGPSHSPSGWVKLLANDRFELGYDWLVESKQASWSRGQQVDLEGAMLSFQGIRVTLTGDNLEYWQADRMAVLLGSSQPSLLARRLSAKGIDGLWHVVEIGSDKKVRMWLSSQRDGG